MELYQHIAVTLKEIRSARKLSQTKMAANTISRWETCTYTPSIDDIQKISIRYGIAPARFFPTETPGAPWAVEAVNSVIQHLSFDETLEVCLFAEFLLSKKSKK